MYEPSIQHSRQYGLIQNRLLAPHTCLLLVVHDNSLPSLKASQCNMHIVHLLFPAEMTWSYSLNVTMQMISWSCVSGHKEWMLALMENLYPLTEWVWLYMYMYMYVHIYTVYVHVWLCSIGKKCTEFRRWKYMYMYATCDYEQFSVCGGVSHISWTSIWQHLTHVMCPTHHIFAGRCQVNTQASLPEALLSTREEHTGDCSYKLLLCKSSCDLNMSLHLECSVC